MTSSFVSHDRSQVCHRPTLAKEVSYIGERPQALPKGIVLGEADWTNCGLSVHSLPIENKNQECSILPPLGCSSSCSSCIDWTLFLSPKPFPTMFVERPLKRHRHRPTIRIFVRQASRGQSPTTARFATRSMSPRSSIWTVRPWQQIAGDHATKTTWWYK